ncbi:MAG: YchJ family metal-binding protein [Myxococcota bacterium]|nr:YchJ family metal-binding protein [Myxococcota bacterium]MEC8424534.1 YchJ family metal-binding protein [Myxococcota bacterium]
MPRDIRCRCGSGRKERRCCGPFLDGRPAPTPAALMRSRYAAYAKGNAAYIMETTDPGGPAFEADAAAWSNGILAFHSRFRFRGVQILDAPDPAGDVGFVTFHARLEAPAGDGSFRERSRFTRADGRWRYHSGTRLP